MRECAMPRLFVAVDLPETVRERLVDLCGGVPGARWVPPEQFHLTLSFLGDVDGGLGKDVEEALATVSAPAFELILRGVGHFPPRGEPRVLWVGFRASEPLMALQRVVERVLAQAGCELERRKFHPHVTLARLKEAPARRVVEWLGTFGGFESASFQVSEVLLYSSLLGHAGATHRVERTYPLG